MSSHVVQFRPHGSVTELTRCIMDGRVEGGWWKPAKTGGGGHLPRCHGAVAPQKNTCAVCVFTGDTLGCVFSCSVSSASGIRGDDDEGM